jgi:hypothetical protein
MIRISNIPGCAWDPSCEACMRMSTELACTAAVPEQSLHAHARGPARAYLGLPRSASASCTSFAPAPI